MREEEWKIVFVVHIYIQGVLTYCGPHFSAVYYKFYQNLNSAESSVMVLIVIVRFHNPKIHIVRNPQDSAVSTYDPHLVRKFFCTIFRTK